MHQRISKANQVPVNPPPVLIKQQLTSTVPKIEGLDEVQYFIYDHLGLNKILSGDKLLKKEFKIVCEQTILNTNIPETKKRLYQTYIEQLQL